MKKLESNVLFILQPVSQIVIYFILYTIVWEILLKLNLINHHNFWDLTTWYLYSCFMGISVIMGLLIYFLKRNNYMIIGGMILIFILMTINDFFGSPKIILIVWGEAIISILLPFLYFKSRLKHSAP
jgi:hypothetical protein